MSTLIEKFLSNESEWNYAKILIFNENDFLLSLNSFMNFQAYIDDLIYELLVFDFSQFIVLLLF